MRRLLVGNFLLFFALAGSANGGITLPAPGPFNSLPAGDFNIYSLAFLQNLVDGGTPSQGDPFYVPSGPGQIKDDVVIATSPNNGPLNANFSGMDDAYRTPGGVGDPDFFTTESVADPGTSNGANPSMDTAITWDSDVASMRTYLNNAGGELVMFFNLNDDNSTSPNPLDGQDILAWMQVTLTGSTSGLADKVFYLSALDDPLTGIDEHALGLASSMANGGNMLVADPSDVLFNESDARWAYVHGAITVAADGSFLHFGPKLATDPSGAKQLNQNLGADRAAFGVYNKELSDLVLLGDYQNIKIDLRLSKLSNGGEQLFIQATNISTTTDVVPEPASLAAWAVLFAAFCVVRRRRKK